EQGEQYRGNQDDESDPGIRSQVACIPQASEYLPESCALLVVHHDAQARVEPGMREVDVFGALLCDGEIGDGHVDVARSRGIDKLADGSDLHISAAPTEVTR